MEQKIKIGDLDLIISDNQIKNSDFFVEFDNDKVKPVLYQLLEENFENYHLNGIDVIVVHKETINLSNLNYKKIENI